MCLSNLTTTEPLVATEDMMVYKFLDTVNENRLLFGIKQALVTPYQRKKVKIGKTYKSDLYREEDRYYEEDLSTVRMGLHSFESLEETIKVAKDAYPEELLYKIKVAMCIIPKGSKYYKGTFGESVSYASNKLKYVKIIG